MYDLYCVPVLVINAVATVCANRTALYGAAGSTEKKPRRASEMNIVLWNTLRRTCKRS